MNHVRHTGNRMLFMSFVVSVLAIGATAYGSDEILDPTSYRSASGEYELFVDPSAASGGGPGTYLLRRAGAEVWSGERPFTLWDAVVTDKGEICGYAYEGGVSSGGHHGSSYEGLSIVILNRDGDVRLRDDLTGKTGVSINYSSGSDSPAVDGMMVDPVRDRFVIRVGGAKNPSIWWTYSLSDGGSAGDIFPVPPTDGEEQHSTELFADLVPGTPLTLVHWHVYDYDFDFETIARSAVLNLMDAGGQPVWEYRIPDEYTDVGSGWDWYWYMQETGRPQHEVKERGFSFRSHSLGHRLSFAVDEDPNAASGWSVRETGRVAEAVSLERPPRKRTELQSIELEYLGTLELQANRPEETSLGSPTGFAFDADGNFGFIRLGDDQSFVFVRADPDGRVLSEHTLAIPSADRTLLGGVASVGEDRWVCISHRSAGRGYESRAWWIDAETGAVEQVAGFKGGWNKAVEPTGDGGFVTLSSHHLEYTIQDEIQLYDKDGQAEWKRREPGYGQGFSFDSITWLPDGPAGLDNVPGAIVLMDRHGAHVGSLDITAILGREPNYPSDIWADKDGGLILHDFRGTPPIHRIDAQGKLVASFHPRYPDGRTFSIGQIRCAPDGRLWTEDNGALLRLDENGVVDKILGAAPDDTALGEVNTLTVDGAGRIYALDERTAAVHVFDSDGAFLRICRPLPTDFETGGGNFGAIAVDGSGDVYVRTGGESSGPSEEAYLHFSADGQRLGFETLSIDSVQEDWLFKPHSRERWVLGYRDIHLVDADGHVAKEIKRRPDSRWLRRVVAGAVAPDGSLAVITMPTNPRSFGPDFLCIFEADGTPLRMIEMAPAMVVFGMVFNGSAVVVADVGSLVLYDIDGGAPSRIVLPLVDGEQKLWLPYFSPDGSEVWIHNTETTALQRYKIP